PYYLNESDPGNNLNTTIVEVFPLADLEPVEAVLKSGDTTITIPHEGQFFSIHVKVSNEEGDGSATYDITCYLDDLGSAPLGTVTDRYLSAGAQTNFFSLASYVFPDGTAGTHTLYIVVDEDESVMEYVKSNNILELSITVIRRAELEISAGDIYVDQRIFADGEDVEITATVRNTGEMDATNVQVLFFIDEDENGEYGTTDTYLDTKTILLVPAPEAGQTEGQGLVSMIWRAKTSLPTNTYSIGVQVNPNGNTPADEYDMTNNMAFTDVQVTLTRDISLSPLPDEFDFTTISNNSALISVRIYVEEQGISFEDGDHLWVRFYDDIDEDGIADPEEMFYEEDMASSLDEIAAGYKVTVTATWLAPDSIRSRIHDILVTVNEGGDVNEVDSGNNLAWRAMVDPRPDLILAS
ncbi:MAG: hypothetical protein KAT70_00880, partial [Thermoplasmata archaeon]|nr:hypothetical protein [Thermoplasmata archaeon]